MPRCFRFAFADSMCPARLGGRFDVFKVWQVSEVFGASVFVFTDPTFLLPGPCFRFGFAYGESICPASLGGYAGVVFTSVHAANERNTWSPRVPTRSLCSLTSYSSIKEATPALRHFDGAEKHFKWRSVNLRLKSATLHHSKCA